jgi:PAS domain S-box-containing protein
MLFMLASAFISALAGALQQTTRDAIRQRLWLEQTLAGVGDAVVGATTSGQVHFLNGVAETLTGWTSRDAHGRTMDEVAPLVDDGDGSQTLVSRDGKRIPVEGSIVTIFDQASNPAGQVRVFRDITERKLNERKLRASYEHTNSILESIQDAFAAVDEECRFTYVNDAMLRLSGRSREDLIGKLVWELFPNEQSRESGLALHRALTERTVANWEESYEKTNRFVSGTAYPSAQGVSVFVRDITERRNAEQKLRDAETRLRRFLESGIIGVIETDDAGRILESNDAFLRMVGYTYEDLTQHRLNWSGMTPPEFLAADQRGVDEANARGACTPYEKAYIRRDGSYLPILIGYARLERQTARYLCFVLDLTALKTVEKERLDLLHREQEARATAEQTADLLRRSNSELQQFAYIASHDLQEPLRTIASFTQLLEKRYKGKIDASADEYISFVVDAARKMTSLIQDLLNFSRLSAASLEFEPVDTGAVVRSVLLNLTEAINESAAKIEVSELPSVPGDRRQLSQLFQNLLSNAIKYRGTDEPRIRVSAQRNGNFWIFAIRDNGIGIAPEYSERIFGVFKRLHGSEYPGTGIGLAICKKIVEQHGGHIWVNSVPGEGSEFVFRLPTDPA